MDVHNLDSFDQQILSLLTKNARYSYPEIGDIIGRSRVAEKVVLTPLKKKELSKNTQLSSILKKSAEQSPVILRLRHSQNT